MSDSPAPPKFTNRLAREKSPYLLQHAHNPVDWFPWGAEALDKAAAEDKMLFVSIGYATCHWCHVMERETFEDEAVAGFLNSHFVPIKVDREERPDVDKIFMDALHALGQQGGWPLNMFATPDGRPVAGGTYFPPLDVHGRRGFATVVEMIQQAWASDRQAVLGNAVALSEHLQKQAGLTSPRVPAWDAAPLEAAAEMFTRSYDREQGGFSLQPQNKFPPSMGLMLLLRQHARTGGTGNTGSTGGNNGSDLLQMVEHTLKKMVGGGIYDQLGGGLSRYSTDYRWLVPHFEKMLYDNALFAQALTEAHLVTGKPFYRAYAEDVLEYVLRDMTSTEGAFFSAEDADSEGEEGLFYVWTPAQVAEVLDGESARCALAYWDISEGGNFDHGASIPNTPRPLEAVAAGLGLSAEELAARLPEAREALMAARARRVRPLRDDKVLTSWNALMISAFARAGRAFGDASLVGAARRAGQFLLENLRDGDGRLLRRYREGEARFKGYLVDHSQLAVACLDLYEATFETAWFAEAVRLMGEVNRLFRNEQGPYYDTGSDAEKLLARNMEGYDGVEPSGNSAAAQALLRLHAYGVRDGFETDALRILAGFQAHLSQAGVSFGAMLAALAFHLAPPREVAIVGEPGHPETQAMLTTINTRFRPDVVLAFAAPADAAQAGQTVPLLQGREAIGGRPTAYLCREMACRLPVHTAQELEALLAE